MALAPQPLLNQGVVLQAHLLHPWNELPDFICNCFNLCDSKDVNQKSALRMDIPAHILSPAPLSLLINFH